MLGVGAALLGARAVSWEVAHAPRSLLGMLYAISQVVALALFALTVVVLLDRGRRRRPGEPTGTLDVFVTVCGEPPDVVEQAIRSAMAIEHPHRTVVLNDGRIAGRPGWEAIDALAVRLGVEVITRTTGVRSKAGNLNHALASSNADFVVTIDGDHRCEPDLGHRLLRWFDDPQIAFVAASQRFDVGDDVLNSRQRFFYEWIQPAKDAGGFAISCGSGVAYRRAALDDVGGFSEWNVVEDLHTSYVLHSAGWRSVYERDAVTTGSAPRTAAEYATQRARWALDTTRILLFDNPLWRRGLAPRGRLHYLHTTLGYVLGLPIALFLLGPPLYVIGRVSVGGGTSVGDYLAHALPYMGALVAFFVSLVGPRAAVATMRGTIFDSWIAVVAIVRALSGTRRGGVTTKRGQRRMSWLVLPQLVVNALLLTALVVAVVDDRPGASAIAVVWVGINAVALSGPLAACSERARVNRMTSATVHVVVVALAAVAVTTTVRESLDPTASAVVDPERADPEVLVVPPRRDPSPAPGADDLADDGATRPGRGPTADVDGPIVTAAPREPTELVAPAGATYVGVSFEGLQAEEGGIREWSADRAGARPQIVNWFQHWGSGENRFRADWVDQVDRQGAIPMITWEPWAKPDGEYAAPEQTEFSLRRIAAGDFDGYVRTWAQAAAAHRGPILIRFMHEFNGIWYPWSLGLNDQTAADYVAAWRHVHGIFQAEGATNVSWVWSIVDGFQDTAAAYPGDDVVDWVGGTVINASWEPPGGQQFAELTRSMYANLAAYGKPVMYPEVGTHNEGGDVAGWISGVFDTIAAEQPAVGAVVMFDMRYDDETDYRLPPEGAAALRDAMADPRFSPPLALAPSS